MPYTNTKENGKSCPSCGSTRTRLARRGESRSMGIAGLRAYWKCTSCGGVFEPPCRKVLSLAVMGAGLLMVYAAVALFLESTPDLAAGRFALRCGFTLLACWGGIYILIMGVRSLLWLRKREQRTAGHGNDLIGPADPPYPPGGKSCG